MIPTLVLATSILAAPDHITQSTELGPVRVTTTLTPKNPKIGDEIVFEIVVRAKPDVDVLMPEFGEALSRYTILDYIPRQKVADDGSTTYIQRYTLQPYVSGAQSIPPILVEFVDNRPGHKPAPDDLDAYEILTERISFRVESTLPENATGKLNPPLGKLELTRPSNRWTSIWLIGGTLGVLIATSAGYLLWRSRRKRVRRRNAYDIARARLDLLLARDLPQDEAAIDAFFVEISAIIRRYLEDRFDLRAPELTTEEFLVVAGESGALTHEHHLLLRDFLRQADLVKFAGVRATEQEIRASIDLAKRFLEDTRENAPLIEVPDAADIANASIVVPTSTAVPTVDSESRGEADV